MIEIINKQKEFYSNHSTKSIDFRIRKLKELRAEIIKRECDITEAIYQDFKKSEFEVLSSEIGVVLGELNKVIRNLKRWSKPTKVLPAFVNFPSTAKIYKEPYGTMLIISPWNYPFNLAMIPLIGAVAGGNTVVLKPSENTINTSMIMTQIVDAVFDKEHVIVIQGDAKIAQSLLEKKWEYIFFTGSVKIGKIVNQAAAKHLTPVTLELGGKSPCIVDETANLKVAAKRIVWGKFINAGQTCIAPDYILVDSNKADKLIELLKKEIIEAYGNKPRDSMDFPRIINKANFTRLQAMLEGEDIYFGGETDENDKYISPTIMLNPSLKSMVMEGEIFGPILPVLTYNNQEEIREILSLYPNPLSFYIFSNSKSNQSYYINNYSFGGGTINDTVVHFVNDRLPFGGVGNSGIGAYHGKYSFDTFTRNKSVVKRYNWLDIPIRYLPSNNTKKRLINFFLTGRFKR